MRVCVCVCVCVSSGSDGRGLCKEALHCPAAQTVALLQAQSAAGQRSGRGQSEGCWDGVLRADGRLRAQTGAALSSRAQLEQMGAAVSARVMLFMFLYDLLLFINQNKDIFP